MRIQATRAQLLMRDVGTNVKIKIITERTFGFELTLNPIVNYRTVMQQCDK